MAEKDTFTPEEKQELLKFARETIRTALNGEPAPTVPDMAGKLERQGSCFVTLHTSDGNLRGCIGNIAAYEQLGSNIRHNAINSAFHDPRFPALTAPEFDDIEVEISILTPLEPINSPDEFEIGRHGIVLQCSGRSAVFLPQVAPEQGWDRATTLNYLSMKAGLGTSAWRSADAKFQVFEAIVFSEKDFN